MISQDIDLVTGLGTMPPRPYIYSANIGTATTILHRVEKQRVFESFIMENLLTATNTFHFEDDGAVNMYTCNYNGNHEPQQIDFIFSSDNSLRSRTFDSSATNSDHWGLIATVKSKHVKTPRKKTVRKPIGWECRDRISYNNEVHAFLNMDDRHLAQESRHSDEGPFAQYVFTDGSARKTSRQETCAGKVFTAMKSYQNWDDIPFVEACGPVQIAEGEEYCAGATHATNNTAEMQALIEALFWLNSCVEQQGLPSFSKVMITEDSLYVKGFIDEKFVARENRALAILLCHMWRVTKRRLQLHIRCVRGLVTWVILSLMSSTRLEAHRWWKRAQPMGRLGGRRLLCKDIESTKRNNTV